MLHRWEQFAAAARSLLAPTLVAVIGALLVGAASSGAADTERSERSLGLTMLSAPPALESSTTAIFEFDSPGIRRVECAIDGLQWQRCSSPEFFYDLDEGDHGFAVRPAGSTNPSEWITHLWSIDRTEPKLILRSKAPTVRGRVVLSFDSSEPVERMRCWHDKAAARPCSLERAGFGDLDKGTHRLFAEAFDAAGNTTLWKTDVKLAPASGDSASADPPASEPTTSDTGGNSSVRVGATKTNSDRYETIPIVRSAGSNGERSILSLEPSELGEIERGSVLKANAEFEVSLQCFEPGNQCLNSSPIYSYSPTVRWKLALAASPGETKAEKLLDITSWQDRECSAQVPNRNHHCVYTAEGDLSIPALNQLPCAPQRCFVNLIVEAYDSRAGGSDKLAIGTVDSDGKHSQDRGVINSILQGPGNRSADRVLRTSKERDGSIPIEMDGTPEHIVYTVAVPGLKAGDQLAITGKLIGDLHSLRYNALFVSQIVISKSRRTHNLKGIRNDLSRNGLINKSNGFNCTAGKSAFQSPCPRYKYGSVRVTRDINETVYIHLVGSANYQPGGDFYSGLMRFASAGFLEVKKFSSN